VFSIYIVYLHFRKLALEPDSVYSLWLGDAWILSVLTSVLWPRPGLS